jgi:5-formyltetrahydrofolate cyclo-ligase
MDKSALRRDFRHRRRAFVHGLTERERADAALAASRHLAAHIAADGALASYVAAGSEIDPRPLDRMAYDAGMRVGFPWFRDRQAPMAFHEAEGFEPGPFGILQPAGGSPLIWPDIVVVPLVAIDRSGNRLGQGAGHYDAALARLRRHGKPFLAIGFAYDVQIADSLPADPWDIPLDAVATPTRWIEFPR